MADRFNHLDISYDDKRWGNIIDPGEWNQNFHEIENWVNALVTDLNNGILTPEDVQELFDEFSETFAKTEDVNEMLSFIQSAVNEKVSKSGDTLTGALTLHGDPTEPLHAATKQYVDNNKLQNVKDGTANSVLLGDIENNVASGDRSVAEGSYTKANGQYSHAEGYNTKAFGGTASHSEGSETYALYGSGSHAEGGGTTAANGSHAEGIKTTALGSNGHSEGHGSAAVGRASHAEGIPVANGVPISYSNITHIFDNGNEYTVNISGAAYSKVFTFTSDNVDRMKNGMIGYETGKYTPNTFVLYLRDTVLTPSGPHYHLENTVRIIEDIDFTNLTITLDQSISSIAINNKTAYVVQAMNLAYGEGSHLEGCAYLSKAKASHAEGEGTLAIGMGSHAEGFYTFAEGDYSHAEGGGNYTDEYYGKRGTVASGDYSHAEGLKTQANGTASHSEGYNTQANGDYSHAEGLGTCANGQNQRASGKYNIVDDNDVYAEIVGNGRNNANRSNARTLDWNGNETLAGKLTVGSSPENDMDVATKQYVDNIITITGTTLNIL